MRVTGVWFHRNDFLFSSDADMVSTLRTSIFKAVPQSDDQIYDSVGGASGNNNNAHGSSSPSSSYFDTNSLDSSAALGTGNQTFYSLTYGEGCDAIKIAVVPVALERDNFAAFACVGASDGFSVATLVAIARRMGNAIRLLIPQEDFIQNNFRRNKVEIRAVLSFTRRSLSEPDLIHGALSEAFVDSIFDTTKPKFTQLAHHHNQNNNNNHNKGGKKNKDQQQQEANNDIDNDGSSGENEHSLTYWSNDPVNPIHEVHWIRGAVLCGNYVINSFEDSSVAQSCQTTPLGWDGFLYLARVMSSFGCDQKLMEHATHLENEMMIGEDTFRHLKIFRDDVLHTVEINEQAKKEVAEHVPLENRTALRVSARKPRNSCDVTAVTGELLRELDQISKEIQQQQGCGENEDDEQNPELTAMLKTLAGRYADAPQKYENFANAVHSSNCVDSLKHWGEAETRGFGITTEEEEEEEEENSSTAETKKSESADEEGHQNHATIKKTKLPPKLSNERPALHYRIRCPDNNLQFFLSFKFVSFEDKENNNNNNNEEGEQNENNANREQNKNNNNSNSKKESTSSDGYCIALFSYCIQYSADGATKPRHVKITNNGFYPVLDEVIERMVQTANEDETALDTNIWSKIRSGRTGEQYFEKLSPHLLAIDVVDRSLLLDPPNARILFDEFDPDIISSRLVPRLVRRSPILESVDKDEAKGSTNIARKQALQELMDTFRRSISRAQQMFATGSVEGMWSTSEGAFFHGLFLTRSIKIPGNQISNVFPGINTTGGSAFGGGGGGGGGNNNTMNANNANRGGGQQQQNDGGLKSNANILNSNNRGGGGGVDGGGGGGGAGAAVGSDLNTPNNNNNTNNIETVALIAAPQKYLSKLPFGCLVPPQTSMIGSPFSPAGGAGNSNNYNAGSGSWTNLRDMQQQQQQQQQGNNNNNDNNNLNNNVNSPAVAGSLSSFLQQFHCSEWRDIPMARVFHDNAPAIPQVPSVTNDNLPLGLLEVHCMFTPNTEIEQMPSEVYYALSQMHAF